MAKSTRSSFKPRRRARSAVCCTLSSALMLQHTAAGARDGAGDLHDQSALADAGVTAQQNITAVHDAAAQDPVDSPMPDEIRWPESRLGVSIQL